MKRLPITMNKISLDEKTDQTAFFHKNFTKRFETIHTIKNVQVKIQTKPGCYPLRQKARPIPYHRR